MLKSLRLKNFKSHKNTKLVFHKGLNAIIGKGMSGKSNIVRSIKMLYSLRPLNGRYKSNFTSGSTRITAETDDGYVISLKRERNNSEYVLKNNEERQEFRKFGKEVPKEIKEALNIEEINIQEQLDPPFVVLSTGSNIIKIINAATGVEHIDSWNRELSSRIRALNMILDEAKEEEKNVQKELSKLKDLNKLGTKIKTLRKIRREVEKLEEKGYKIESTIAEIINSSKVIKKLRKGLGAIDILTKIKDNIKEKEFLQIEKEDVIAVIESQEGLSLLRKELKADENKYIEFYKDVKACPFCFSKITDDQRKKIKNEIDSSIRHSWNK